MTDKIVKLYPAPTQEVNLQNLYLKENLRALSTRLARPIVYSNFVTSLDGRIAIPHPSGSGMKVPEDIANPRDWRLFQELAVQADVLITSGRYLRDYAEGQAQEILRVYDDPRFSDLRDWRHSHGLPTQPDLAVISRSLQFPIPAFLTQGNRKVIVITSSGASSDRMQRIEDQLGTLMIAGEDSVDGKQMIQGLSNFGYRMVYSTSGPKVLHMLLAADVLDRQYLTLANRIQGGEPFSSIVEGPLFDPPIDFQLRSIYFDPHAFNGSGQLFLCYDRDR